MDSEAFSLFDDRGQRLYLTLDERTAFRSVGKAQGERELLTFCHLLTYTGCRVSEALETTLALNRPTNCATVPGGLERLWTCPEPYAWPLVAVRYLRPLRVADSSYTSSS